MNSKDYHKKGRFRYLDDDLPYFEEDTSAARRRGDWIVKIAGIVLLLMLLGGLILFLLRLTEH